MQRFISGGKRTEELTAQVAQLWRELEEANAAAEKRTEELTAQVTQLRRELEEATRAIKRESPVTNVIVATIDENPDCLFEALKDQPAKQPGGEQNKERPRGGPPS